jgi:hypothetical protein
MCCSDPLCKDFSRISLQSLELPEEKEDFSMQPLLPNFLEQEAARLEKESKGPLILSDCYKKALLIFQIAKSALAALEKRELDQFDALVGDTSCQIPALFVSSFVRELTPGMQKELPRVSATIDEKIKLLAEKIQSCKAEVTTASLLDAINPYDVFVPKKIIPIIQARLLKEVRNLQEYANAHFMKKQLPGPKRPNGPLCTHCKREVEDAIVEKSIPSQLHCFYGKQKKKLNDLEEITLSAITSGAQKALANFSCDYLQQAASTANLDYAPLLNKSKKIINVKWTYQEKEYTKVFPQLPCFYSASAVFDLAMKRGFPILLTLRDAKHTLERFTNKDHYDLMFYYTPEDGKYVPAIPKKSQLDAPLIVIEGQRCGKIESLRDYQRHIAAFDILHLVHLNAAAHAQYMDEEESVPEKIIEISDKEKTKIEGLMKEAEIVGAHCRKNQSTLGITHIYSSTLRCEKNNVKKKDIIVVVP